MVGPGAVHADVVAVARAGDEPLLRATADVRRRGREPAPAVVVTAEVVPVRTAENARLIAAAGRLRPLDELPRIVGLYAAGEVALEAGGERGSVVRAALAGVDALVDVEQRRRHLGSVVHPVEPPRAGRGPAGLGDGP